jgi:S1-C subfamily serine protease
VIVVDALVALFALALAAVGYERGFIRSVMPLLGFVGGAATGARLGPALLPDGSESAYAPVITLLSGILLGAALAVAMEGVGVVVRERIVGTARPGVVEGLGGALVLGALGLLIAWAFGAVALHAPGSNARELRSAVQRSVLLGALNDALPPSGPLLNVLRRIDPTPAVEGPEARVPAPDAAIASDPEVTAAGESVVRILGTACGLSVGGSGWVAGPDLVVTNAHVVAGEDDTTVTPQAGTPELPATVVRYEPRNDLALLRVGGLGLEPLELVPQPRTGTSGAILGYPENGPFTIAPARLGTTGTVTSQDSYGRGPLKREMTAFRGKVVSGNSGGPAVDGDGDVLTTVFAAEQGSRADGGLGVPNEVVADALEGPLRPVDTGPCAL